MVASPARLRAPRALRGGGARPPGRPPRPPAPAPPARRVSPRGGAVLTFPEGVKALRRPFRERYRLLEFGHGFMHVALGTGAPIVPVAVIGPEEEAPLLADPAWLARLVRTPVAPLTPTLVVPLPVKYRIHFGPPLRVRGPAAPAARARHGAGGGAARP